MVAIPKWLRPSALPKLALCGSYRSEENAGPAAERGSAMDAVFRSLIAGANVPVPTLDAIDREAVRWAVDTAQALAGSSVLISDEESLKVHACGMEGTADLLCVGGSWSADLKTGQKRNYREQQAAYALGFMEANFVEEWTVYLIYADLQEVETLRFTLEEAEALVRVTVANAKGGFPPQANEYCGWCANRFSCTARREALGIYPFDGPDSIAFAFETATSDQLREFVLRSGVVEDYADKAREILKTRAINGDKIKGVSVVPKRGARKIDLEHLAPAFEANPAATLALMGGVTEAKALEIWRAGGVAADSFPRERVEEMPGSSYVRVSRPKQSTFNQTKPK